jgi:AcrR family transcriptional regulator
VAKRLESGQRREQILHESLTIISRSGLRGLSMAELARRVGIVPSAIYRHFPSKQRLIAALFEHLRDRVFANIEEAGTSTTDPVERLHVILMQNVSLIRHFQAIPRIIMSDSVFSGSVEIRRLAYDLVRSIQTRLAKIITEGQIRGQIRSELDPHAVAVLFWGIMPPMTILWMISDGRFDVNRHVVTAWDHFRRAVVVK